MLSPTSETWRIFFHLLAASIWIGGQFILAGVVPVVRETNRELLPKIARRFAQLSWPAFAVVVLTGFWNIFEINVTDHSTAYQVTLFLKVALAIGSAVAAFIHSVSNGKLGKALGGAVSLLFGLAALFVGLLLQTGG